MNDKLRIIFERRSVRRYQDKPVTEDMVKDMLEAAMAAPSAVARDPWHFIVVRDKQMLARIAEGLPNGKMLADAGVGIIVCGDIEKAHDNQVSYMIQDCSAAIENMLVAASALGLGACWLGVHPREERIAYIKDIFGLPENIIPVAAISIGLPDEHREARTRYVSSAVHMEKF